MNSYKEFWDWFQQNEHYFNTSIEDESVNIAVDIKEHLHKVHPHIEFEIPFEIQNGKRELIISADGEIKLFPIVTDLVKQAPLLEHFDVIAFRPRTYQLDQVIEVEGLSLCYKDIFFKVNTINPLSIDVFIRGYDNIDNRYVHAYFLLLDTLIGEYDAVTVIKETIVNPLNNEKINTLRPIKEIIDLVDKIKLQM